MNSRRALLVPLLFLSAALTAQADSDGVSQVGGPQVMSNCGFDGETDCDPVAQDSQQDTPRAVEADSADGTATAEQDATEEESTADEAEEEDVYEDADAEEDAEVEDTEEEE